MMNSENSFSEKQRFTQWWIWLILIFVAVLPLVIQLIELFSKSSSQSNILDTESILLSILTGMFVIVLFLSMQLNTRLDHDGIHLRFFPFHWRYRTYKWSEIESASVRKYSPLLEYGGWGLRGFRSDRAFNVRGNMGLQLVFKNGDRLLIGTQKAEEIEKTMARMIEKKNAK